MKRDVKALLWAVCLSVVACASGLAQESRGAIVGRVSDSSGAVVPEVQVRAVNAATGTEAVARTNESGNYTIPYLLPGTYTVHAEAAGFKGIQRDGIQVRVNDNLEVNLTMVVGDVSEKIEVTDTTPLLETTNASLGQVVDPRRVEDLPVQAGNAFELALLTPGMTNTANLRMRKAASPGATSSLSTDGNPDGANEFTIDGVTNVAANSGSVAFSPPQSAVSEFKVQTSSFDASLGHTTGAVVNVSTTSGTNQPHGEAHYWIANSALDTPDFFQNAARQTKPVYQDNRFGASLGGPVYLPKVYNGKNRTFFFYAWETNTWGVPKNNVMTVPTAVERTGDFSALLAQGSRYQIYDPATIRDAGNGRFSRQPFPGNLIPSSRIDGIAKNIMPYWGMPNVAGTADGRNNYSVAHKALSDYWVHLARIDHSFSANHRAYVRLHADHFTNNKDDFFKNIAHGTLEGRDNRGLAVDDVLVLGPSRVLNVRYGLTYVELPSVRRSRGFDISSLGFSPALVALTDRKIGTLPDLRFEAFQEIGGWDGSGKDGDGAENGIAHSLTANVVELRASHNVKYGVEARVNRGFKTQVAYDVSPALIYGSLWTRGPLDNSTSAPVGQDFASFLLGLPTDGQMNRSASFAVQDKFLALYVQDDWKLTRRLTVNLGLRYELETPVTERFDRSVKGFAFDTANPIEAQARANYAAKPIPEILPANFRVRGGYTFVGANNREMWKGQTWNFMPRIGLAFQLTPSTVIRSGYGIFFSPAGIQDTEIVQDGFTAVTPLIASLDNGLSFIANTANPFPNGLRSPLGATGGLTTNLGQGISFFPAQRKHPYAQRWSLGIQRQLPGQFVVQGQYVGNRGTRLQVNRQLNSTPAQWLSTSPERDQAKIDFLTQQVANPFFGIDPVYTRTISRADLLKPYPQFGNVSVREPVGYSWYHAAQFQAEKRMSRGYTFQFAYTFSKMMTANEFLNPTDPMPYESIATLDRPHRVAASAILEMPFGRGRRFGAAMPAWLDKAAGGWQLNVVMQRQAGAPLNWGNIVFRGNIKDITLPKGERSVDRWFNTDAGFERDNRKALAQNIRTFPLRFSDIRSDGLARWDLSLIKRFHITESANMQFRAECFNAWNHANLNAPNVAPANTAFGTINKTSGLPRQFQFALKLSF